MEANDTITANDVLEGSELFFLCLFLAPDGSDQPTHKQLGFDTEDKAFAKMTELARQDPQFKQDRYPGYWKKVRDTFGVPQ